MLKTLTKGHLNTAHVKNYCFYILNSPEPDPSLSERLSDIELFRLVKDANRHERGRLILRKVHAGEPDEDQLKAAAGIYAQQNFQQNSTVYVPSSNRSQIKIEKLTGESLALLSAILCRQRLQGNENATSTQQHRISKDLLIQRGRPSSMPVPENLSSFTVLDHPANSLPPT
jgi:hypothetical protein